MIALDLDAIFRDGAAAATALLELRCQRFHLCLRQSETGDYGHVLAFPALRLTTHAHDAIAAIVQPVQPAGRTLFTNTLRDCPQAIRTAPAYTGRIDQSFFPAHRNPSANPIARILIRG